MKYVDLNLHLEKYLYMYNLNPYQDRECYPQKTCCIFSSHRYQLFCSNVFWEVYFFCVEFLLSVFSDSFILFQVLGIAVL